MFSAIWLIVKPFAQGALKFFLDYWKIIVPLLALLFCWYQYQSEVARADKAENSLAEYVQSAQLEIARRTAVNEAKDIMTRRIVDKLTSNHLAELKKLSLDREKSATSLKDYYHDKITNRDIRLNAMSQRVLLESEKAAASGRMPAVPGTSEQLAEIRQDGDPADSGLSKIEKACAITTIDYNALHDAWTEACAIHGCKNYELQ